MSNLLGINQICWQISSPNSDVYLQKSKCSKHVHSQLVGFRAPIFSVWILTSQVYLRISSVVFSLHSIQMNFQLKDFRSQFLCLNSVLNLKCLSRKKWDKPLKFWRRKKCEMNIWNPSVVQCAILISNPGVGKLDEDLKSLSRKIWNSKIKSSNRKTWDLNLNFLRRKIWDFDIKSFNTKIWDLNIKFEVGNLRFWNQILN